MNRIYVFTATGNSLKIAGDIAECLGETEVCSIGTIMGQESWKIEGERVGFVFPCYYGSVPRIVTRFIQGAESVDSSYLFSIASAGGNTGLSNSKLNEALKDRGAELSYSRSFLISSNYMNGWYYSSILKSDEEIRRLSDETVKGCRETAKEIQKGVRFRVKEQPMGYRIPRLISPSRYVRDTRPWDKEFTLSDSCNGCGTCHSVCPVSNISLKDKKPVFHGNCQRCMACIQFCPKQAFSIKGKPMNKKRYTHPDVTLKELIDFHREGKKYFSMQ